MQSGDQKEKSADGVNDQDHEEHAMHDVFRQEREIPLNLFRHNAPLLVEVVENRRLTPEGSPNDVRHVVVRYPPGSYWFLEGQSAGFAPPGLNQRGRPHVPRLYSIACDRAGEDGTSTTLTVAVKRVLWKDENGQEVYGLASNMLCDAQPGDTLPMTGPAGKDFVMPDEPELNHVMIATGTGVAPFRGFARRWATWPQEKRGRLWLFFGVQTKLDALYAEEWAKLSTEPDFRLTYAFSREEQTEEGKRMYVQDRIRQAGAEFWELIADPKTHVYICGIKGMETGIEAALENMALAAGTTWHAVRDVLRMSGRWHLEVY